MSDPYDPTSRPSQPEQPGFGQQQPGYGQQPWPAQDPAFGYGQPTHPDRRPGTVLAAAIVTWVCSAITLLVGVLFAIAVGVASDDIVEEFENDENLQESLDTLGIGSQQLADALLWGSILVAVLSALAIVAAALAFRRSNFGRIALVVLSAISALLYLLSFIPLVVAPVVVIVLLFIGGANPWYARRSA